MESVEKIEEAILKAAKDEKITCKQCMEIARSFGVSPKEIGKLVNKLHIKLTECQLGCF
jgi:hypothetical protein